MMKPFLLSFLFLALFGKSFAQNNDSIPSQVIKEVQVTSTNKPSISLSTNPLQITTSTDIDRVGIQSVSDAVRRFTGVVVKDYGGIGGFKAVAIRGNGAEHTTILYDGLPITNTQSGQIDISQFSLDNVDMLSLTIGQSDNIFRSARAIASVGVLDVETRTPVFTDKNYQLQLQLKGGSWGLFNPYLYYAQKLSDRFALSVDGSWQRTDGQYSFDRKNETITTKGKRQNTDVDIKRTELNLLGKLGIGQTLAIKAYYFDSERGLPGAIILQDSGFVKNKNVERLWDRNFFTQAKYINQVADKVDFQIQGKYSHSYTRYLDKDAKYTPTGFQENRYNQNEYYLSGTAQYRLSQNLHFSFAEDFSYSTLRANYNGFASPERFSSLTALSAKYDNKKITLIANLLGTYITENVKIGETADDRKRLSPALSLSYRPFEETNLRLRASYKNTFRVPSFNDLYYLRMGNTSLSPEKAQQYNVGATWTNSFSELFSYFSVAGDFFYNTVRDKIIVYPSTFEPKMTNLGKVRITGMSLSTNASFDLNDRMQLLMSANYTYQKAIDVTNSTEKDYKGQIPYTPLHSGAVSLSLENPWVNFGYSLVLADKSYSSTANNSWYEMDGYADHSISLNKTVYFKGYRFRFQGDVTNLLNKTWYVVKDYPMPGRAYRLGMTVAF